jgi:hypothetical protein
VPWSVPPLFSGTRRPNSLQPTMTARSWALPSAVEIDSRSFQKAWTAPPRVRMRLGWSPAWLLWVSQPPMRAKKTWAGRPFAIICATSFSWVERPEERFDPSSRFTG